MKLILTVFSSKLRYCICEFTLVDYANIAPLVIFKLLSLRFNFDNETFAPNAIANNSPPASLILL